MLINRCLYSSYSSCELNWRPEKVNSSRKRRHVLLAYQNVFNTQATCESMWPLFTNPGLFVNGLWEPTWTQFLVQGQQCAGRLQAGVYGHYQMEDDLPRLQFIFSLRIRITMCWSYIIAKGHQGAHHTYSQGVYKRIYSERKHLHQAVQYRTYTIMCIGQTV